MIWLLFGFGFGGWLLVHMTRPYAQKYRISAAQFFRDLPPPQEKQPRFRLTVPLRSPSFWLQLAWWLLVWAALMFMHRKVDVGGRAASGVWLMMDTSASMTVPTENGSRFDKALVSAEGVTLQLKAMDSLPCIRLSAFDLTRRDLLNDAAPTEVSGVLASLAPRLHDTTLNVVRQVWRQIEQGPEGDCAMTHLVVITDRPAPDWTFEVADGRLLWIDVAEPRNNIGFVDLEAARDPLSGETRALTISSLAYGKPPVDALLKISGPDGQSLPQQPLSFSREGTARNRFVPKRPGAYLFELVPGGDYAFDDRLVIQVPPAEGLQVDWQLNDRTLPQVAGWQITSEDPDLRVLPIGALETAQNNVTIPSLYLADQPAERRNIRDFQEDDILLADINFDVLERQAFATFSLPTGFEPVIRADNGQVWMARRSEPPALALSLGPRFGSSDAAKLSMLAFFNSLRWLLTAPHGDIAPRLAPRDAESVRLTLGSGEGDTSRQALSTGDLAYLTGERQIAAQQPLWPTLVALAAVLFALERVLAAFGGARWR